MSARAMLAAQVEFHPVADVFPLMPEAELEVLAEDIREHGQREPIWLHEGKIIDGRNRYLACQRAGVPPIFQKWAGPGPLVNFVLSMNLLRRHLNEAQRGMIASRVASLPPGSNQYCCFSQVAEAKDFNEDAEISASSPAGAVTQGEAARLLNVSRETVQKARVVQERGVPELVAEVVAGGLAMEPAIQIARKPPEEQRAALAERDQEKRERQARREGKLTETQRQRDIAKAAQKRLFSISGWFDGFVMGFPRLRVDAALAVSSEDERASFINSTSAMISTLKKLLAELKEENA